MTIAHIKGHRRTAILIDIHLTTHEDTIQDHHLPTHRLHHLDIDHHIIAESHHQVLLLVLLHDHPIQHLLLLHLILQRA